MIVGKYNASYPIPFLNAWVHIRVREVPVRSISGVKQIL
jgi:hypothetical protein